MPLEHQEYINPNPTRYSSTLLKQKQYVSLFRYLVKNYILRWLLLAVSAVYHKSGPHTFLFEKQTFNYNTNNYNRSWGCERTVELPIITNKIQPKHKVLELGNVISHYQNVNWTIVDKFERANNVVNVDILNYNPKTKFDLIISISTLEHIGIDDSIINPKHSSKAITSLKRMLNPKGEMFVTIPVGYNRYLDRIFLDNKTFTQVYAMKRLTPWNTWAQVDPVSARNSSYGWPFNNANAIFIGYFKKP